MQKLWLKVLDWEKDLATEHQEFWNQFFHEMGKLNNVAFNRSLNDAVEELMLCISADVLNKAFGTCAYARWETKNNLFLSRFIAEKSRVALLKWMSIPRLELHAAMLNTRLFQSMSE